MGGGVPLYSYPRRSHLWQTQLQKYSLEQYPAPFSGRLYLPLRHMDEDDRAHIVRSSFTQASCFSRNRMTLVSQIKFKTGEDLNFLVYHFYNQQPDPDFKGVNFVSSNGIALKRYVIRSFELLHCPQPRQTIP